MSREFLQQGMAALKAGHKADARRLLEQAVQTDPRSEQGWLWLSGTVETDQERRFCISKVLSINPGNAAAQRGFRALGSGPERSPLEEVKKMPEPLPPQLPTPSTASITCPHCHTKNLSHFRYCDHCGTPLDLPAQDAANLPTSRKEQEGPEVPEADRLILGDVQPGSTVAPSPAAQASSPAEPKLSSSSPSLKQQPELKKLQKTEKPSAARVPIIIVTVIGCLLSVVGLAAALDGSPEGAICSVPGLILTILGGIGLAVTKKR